MKNKVAVLFVCALLACGAASCGQSYGYRPVDPVSSPPESFPKELLDNRVLQNGVAGDGGYYCAGGEKGNTVAFYDVQGRPVWEKEFSFGTPDRSFRYQIAAVQGGGFVLSAACARYQEPEGEWIVTAPVLARCAADGSILWQHTFPGVSDTAFAYLFVLPNGDVITAGSTEKAETAATGTMGLKRAYFSKWSGDGERLGETYGEADEGEIYAAAHLRGRGVAAAIHLPGGGCDLAFLNENLDCLWTRSVGEFVGTDSLAVSGENVYLLSHIKNQSKYRLTRYDLSGNPGENAELPFQDTRFVPGYGGGLLIQQGETLEVYGETLRVLRTYPFNAGDAEKAIEYEDTLLVVSTNQTGTLPQPPDISSIWFSTELVYSVYGGDGALLWRQAVDSTPEAFRHPQPDWTSVDPG